MFTRKLGRSGIEVSAMGLGCWPIGGLIIENGRSVGWGDVDDAESVRAIHCAMEVGVNFFDTAAAYGRSEDLLGRAFENRRDQVVKSNGSYRPRQPVAASCPTRAENDARVSKRLENVRE